MESHNLRVCRHCLEAIRSHEGYQPVIEIYVDDVDDPEESTCEWCELDGNNTLYEFI